MFICKITSNKLVETLDISHLRNGICFVKIITSGKEHVSKFVKQ